MFNNFHFYGILWALNWVSVCLILIGVFRLLIYECFIERSLYLPNKFSSGISQIIFVGLLNNYCSIWTQMLF